MAKEFAKRFYKSKEWKNVRHVAWVRDHGMCQYPGCTRPADEVHHIKHLTPENIHDPEIALNLDNLTCVCRDHHFQIHRDERIAAMKKEKDKRTSTRPHRRHFRKKARFLPDIEFVNGVPVAKQKDICGKLTIVCGAIGSGKTTYCQHTGEPYTDLEEVEPRTKAEQIRRTKQMMEEHGKAMHITCFPTDEENDKLIELAEDVRIVLIDTDPAECERWIMRRQRPRDIIDLDSILKKNRRYFRLFNRNIDSFDELISV